jgi:hypothetical protein
MKEGIALRPRDHASSVSTAGHCLTRLAKLGALRGFQHLVARMHSASGTGHMLAGRQTEIDAVLDR